MTSFWVGEYGPAEIATAPEFAVADGIVSRSTRREAERAIRHLQVLNCRHTLTVLKTRASRHEPEIREFTIIPCSGSR